MIGSEYSRHPEILIVSFQKMGHKYGQRVKNPEKIKPYSNRKGLGTAILSQKGN